MMGQSKIDSFMEALTNIAIGLAVSFVANLLILPAVLGVEISVATNLLIGVAYTIVSLVRSYTIRRLFNGRSVWATIKQAFRHTRLPCHLGIHSWCKYGVNGDVWHECGRCGIDLRCVVDAR